MPDSGTIIVLADDLSGAAELAGIAYGHGLSAEVQREFDGTSAAEIVAVDCDSRILPGPLAAERVREIAAAVAASGPAWIFKKVDSVLRGHVRAEIEVVIAACGYRRAVLVPANPSRGRTIAGGQYCINSVPLDRTEFAGDPEFPRHSASVAALLGGGPGMNIDVPDVATPQDVQRLAATADDTMLAAGAADFFAAVLASRRGLRPLPAAQIAASKIAAPAVLACGSPTAWLTRAEECQAAGLPVMMLDKQQPLSEQQAAAAATLSTSAAVVLATGNYAAAAGERRRQLARFAELVALLLDRGSVATLLAEGGATAAAICQRVGWRRLAIIDSAPAGVGALSPLSAGASPRLFIKPGSYPWPAAIWEQLCQMRAR